MKRMSINIQEAQQIPSTMNSKTQRRHTVITLLKVKARESILEAARERTITHKGSSVRRCRVLTRHTEARRQGADVVHELQELSPKDPIARNTVP